ncbi:hypothetical protein HpDR52_06070 [Helicobacter pylori]
MLENMQDISLQSSHEAGVVALCPELLGGFVSSIKSIYECQKKRKRPQRSTQAHRHCYPKGWSA